ncbi:MAG: nucleoside deaminase [Lachnospiraceae bacterium]|nr:nucleoside deaminase [Lachnospiraceae bacterium]
MAMAIELAREAAGDGETPVGCVITYRGQVIGSGRNRRNTLKDPLAHAEMEAIRQASGFLGDWRLEECTMYVSLEPCPMCAGAIVQSRIPTCVMGAMNPKAGCAGSILNIPETPGFNHHCFLKKGVLEEESRQVLQNFFSQLRNNI